MRIAFYAPMKHPDSPVPSGDREMARNLVTALSRYHEVDLVSRFSSRDGRGDGTRQRRLADIGARLGDRLLLRWRNGDPGRLPQAWFTYHVYHKAPDLLGPEVSHSLGIPYFLAEVSHAPKQAGGPWDRGYRAAERAIRAADGIVGLSNLDAACVLPLLADPSRYHRLQPFTSTSPFAAAAADREIHRRALRGEYGLDESTPLLLAVGMMRHGDKLASYRVLADSLSRLADRAWHLLVIGDGPARRDVERVFAASVDNARVSYLGAVDPDGLPALYAASDLMVWPSVNEAYGMAMLEAQAAGLPVVAGRTGGVPEVVRHNQTGFLCPVGDAPAFADAVSDLLADPARLGRMRSDALSLTAAENDISAAARRLNDILVQTPKVRAA